MKAFLRSACLLALISAGGCCSVATDPTLPQVQGWVAEGIGRDATVDSATRFLKSQGFTVWEYRSASHRHELVGQRRTGVCPINGTSDYIYVRCDLDETGNVLSKNVTQETR